MSYGRVLPKGYLPVFSVDTEREAKLLITMACPTDVEGKHYARELAQEQTMENLVAFSDKLADYWGRYQESLQQRRQPRLAVGDGDTCT